MTDDGGAPDPERRRLAEADAGTAPWRRWGPYLSERQWGTVREDYSADGDAWSYFTHDQARSRAYRWGEDGIAGVSDDKQRLCFALALWNGRDPILKERMFGLTNAEGNHGEDVKEYYFHLDNTPTHSYMKYLYKYPQGEFPYGDLVDVNRARGRRDAEYELLDTGVFDEDRYFDVVVEYAKAGPEDLLVEITAHNRGPDEAALHLLPTLWFRHTWSWAGGSAVPALRATDGAIRADHEELGPRWLHHEGGPEAALFTDNETDDERIFGTPNTTPYVKNGIDRRVVHGETDAVNPLRTGTKAAVHHVLTVPGGASATVRLRLTDAELPDPWRDFGQVMDVRRTEADAFYDGLTPDGMDEERRRLVRQALAGMLWSKQYYYLDVERWLAEHGVDPLAADPRLRNSGWYHMVNDEIMSMPDTWEYPWFAAWDLAFHTLPLAMVDIAFAKGQLELLLRRLYLHPNGQIPAYEWNFGDVNPPVHAWAVLFVYELEKHRTGRGDRAFLENAFQKLTKNFTWWLNRKDVDGNNVFQGGFLGLDNIGVFDRSAPLPTGGHLDQADGTAWMALYCQNLLDIAIELAVDNPVYVEQAQMLFEHFAWIAVAMNRIGKDNASLWDEEDGFFYDVLRLPDGSATPLKVRSLVGLIPLAATSIIGGRADRIFPELVEGAREFIRRHPAVEAFVSQHVTTDPGADGRFLFALFGEDRLRRILARMLDEDEFLGPHGIRSLSRHHAEHPYAFEVYGETYGVGYLPAESDSGMFGGNSNWRGPVWFPINILLIRALLNLHGYHGPDFTVECPTGSGRRLNLYEVAREISDRLTAAFLPDADGHRPAHGDQPQFAKDPHWKDLILFYEYFHGDSGAGLGASHQTGWTGLVAASATLFHTISADAWRSGSGRDSLRPVDGPDRPGGSDGSLGEREEPLS
ncbi:glucosidase [Streptomyces sp. NBC_01275]|uniref:MGH1-like glycoside hydrolase domain-containing protein n=1 Tax=Streptomyces sp. NBC_01275 TaxID=2903807 RepID=UPI00224F0F49|nr:glucosidase [Streptomyces sp. NBC_01275]MCX4759911.1 glucosidase [Streptomyces sp. NBC_01275]